MTAPKESGRQATRAILFEEMVASLQLTQLIVEAIAHIESLPEPEPGPEDVEAGGETMAGLAESLEQDSCALCNGLGRLSSVDWTRD